MKYSSYISFIWKNPIARFFYNKTEKPILSIMDWCGKHVGITVLILLVIGMGLRIGYRGMVDRPERDEVTYVNIIERFVDPNVDINQDLQPALIYVGGALHYIGWDVILGLRCFNMMCSLLWLFVMYFLGKTIFNSSKAGLACLTITVFNPYTIRIAGQIMREPLYLLIISVCLLCAVQLILGNKMLFNSILLGFLTVLGIISRYEGLELLFIMPVAAIFYGLSIFRPHTQKQKYIKIISCLALYLTILITSLTVLYIIYPGYEETIKDKFLQNYNNITANNDNL